MGGIFHFYSNLIKITSVYKQWKTLCPAEVPPKKNARLNAMLKNIAKKFIRGMV